MSFRLLHVFTMISNKESEILLRLKMKYLLNFSHKTNRTKLN